MNVDAAGRHAMENREYLTKTGAGGAKMQLQLKTHCKKCAATLRADGLAYICSYECTFCSVCAAESQGTCPDCGGELVRRARRLAPAPAAGNNEAVEEWTSRPWLVWAASFFIWTVVALAASGSVYELWRSRGYPMTLGSVLGLEFSQILTYAPLTPLVFALALRFPIRRENWLRRSLLHLLFALVFSVGHTTLRWITPYAAWDAKIEGFLSGIWNPHAHIFQMNWPIFKNLFLTNIVDDTTGTYALIVLVAHAVSYYRRLRDRELHSTKLEMQLATSRLEALKSHLQPHFLFNTLHSISALMLTDVGAADRMMVRLSDLLRMSLEGNEIQMTCLSRELEFVTGYLEIEKIRFEDRLNVVFDIAAETLDAQVPSLLLQPLVENAVRHGISRLSAGGKIRITARRAGGDLRLGVRDNGPGLNQGTSAPSATGLGLRTTRERLQTLYGENQSFEIRAGVDGGVEVCVRIPFRNEPPLSWVGEGTGLQTANAG